MYAVVVSMVHPLGLPVSLFLFLVTRRPTRCRNAAIMHISQAFCTKSHHGERIQKSYHTTQQKTGEKRPESVTGVCPKLNVFSNTNGVWEHRSTCDMFQKFISTSSSLESRQVGAGLGGQNYRQNLSDSPTRLFRSGTPRKRLRNFSTSTSTSLCIFRRKQTTPLQERSKISWQQGCAWCSLSLSRRVRARRILKKRENSREVIVM